MKRGENSRWELRRKRASFCTKGLVPNILGSGDADASSELCRAWGQVRDHQSLVFFDLGARANFITPQLAEKLGIKTDEMGPAYTASMAALGHEVAVTPLIEKLQLHIQGYVGHEEFFIMPLEGCDVLLGLVPNILGSGDADASSELCRAWGQVRDHQSLVFFDLGARANFITPQLAEKLGIKTDEMGPAYTASMAALGHEVAVTPLIEKLQLHIQGYVGHEEFFIMPLEGCDVLLDLQAGQSRPPYCIKDNTLYHQQAICIAQPLRQKVLEEAHDSPYAGHRGISANTNALERFFYWPTLRVDVDRYVRECLVCQKVKYERHKVYGKLQPLPVPNTPWERIAMDFITDLPKSKNGNDAIWTIIDRFSKQARFLPIKKTDHMARIFLAHIFKHHGMPKTIVSDKDPRMTSLFWQALFENLGSKLDFSSAYHPQTDGQSEIANVIVLDLLKCYVLKKQSEWKKYLPLVEFAYNNTIHSSIGKAPFEVIYGKPILLPILATKENIFAADEFMHDIDTTYQQVKQAIVRSQEKQKRNADKHRRNLKLEKGQYVLLKF
ncbi:hypothetical protein L7F22_011496 [Adiantum nelumboides]|nr:hypothetical protein [Adiantum nelumboides]